MGVAASLVWADNALHLHALEQDTVAYADLNGTLESDQFLQSQAFVETSKGTVQVSEPAVITEDVTVCGITYLAFKTIRYKITAGNPLENAEVRVGARDSNNAFLARSQVVYVRG